MDKIVEMATEGQPLHQVYESFHTFNSYIVYFFYPA